MERGRLDGLRKPRRVCRNEEEAFQQSAQVYVLSFGVFELSVYPKEARGMRLTFVRRLEGYPNRGRNFGMRSYLTMRRLRKSWDWIDVILGRSTNHELPERRTDRHNTMHVARLQPRERAQDTRRL